MMSTELLSDEECSELEAAVARTLALGGSQPDEGLREACAADASDAYLAARVSGLCREGAIELASDAIREALERARTQVTPAER